MSVKSVLTPAYSRPNSLINIALRTKLKILLAIVHSNPTIEFTAVLFVLDIYHFSLFRIVIRKDSHILRVFVCNPLAILVQNPFLGYINLTKNVLFFFQVLFIERIFMNFLSTNRAVHIIRIPNNIR